jgi:hypothetical protein
MSPAAVPSEATPADAVSELVGSAAQWFDEALKAWSEDDFAKVALLAPLAIEHLGKAALWRKNPALLAPLDQSAEASFIMLTTKPDLQSPQLRTVGLSGLLSRLEKVADLTMLEPKRRKRLVDVRNGAVHAGTALQSRHILLDCLALASELLRDLERDSRTFYGDHYAAVGVLLDEKRSEVAHKVAAKRVRARRSLTRLEEQLGETGFQEATNRLESEVDDVFDPKDFGGWSRWAAIQECPECGSSARLFGDVDSSDQPDWDVEPTPGGGYEAVLVGIYREVFFTPEAFACNVCKLVLTGTDELREAGLPSSKFEPDPSQLPSYEVHVEDY